MIRKSDKYVNNIKWSYEKQYEKAEYIQPTVASDYINTEYYPNNKTIIEIRYKCTSSLPTNDVTLFATKSSASYANVIWCYYRSSDNQLCVRYRRQDYLTNVYYDTDENYHTLRLSNTEVIYDNEQVVTMPSTSPTFSNELNLLYRTNDSSNGFFKLNYCKIFEQSTLLYNYIPIFNDNKYVLINTIGGEMYGSNKTFTGITYNPSEYLDIIYTKSTLTVIHNNDTVNNLFNYSNYICGYADTPNVTIPNALTIDNIKYDIVTDNNGYYKVYLQQPIKVFTSDIFMHAPTTGEKITTIDMRHVDYDLYCKVIPLINTQGNNKALLTDIYFDFRRLVNVTNLCLFFRQGISNNTYIHGLGTLNATFPRDNASGGNPEDWCLREGSSAGQLKGTLDIRGIDTHNAIDWRRYGSYPVDAAYGSFYNWPGGAARFDTLIIGNLEWPYDRFTGWSTFKILYCTTQTPPSLDRTGANGVTAKNYLAAMPVLQHIYVPTGCLAAYQNASVWSDYASIISELDAPDPLTI